jgi:hypothetical protein
MTLPHMMSRALPLTLAGAALAVVAAVSAPAAGATPKCSDAGPTVTFCETKGSTALTATPPPWNWGGWPGGGYGYPFPAFGYLP